MGQALDSGIQGARFMAHEIIERSDMHLVDDEFILCGHSESAVHHPK